MMNLIPKRSWFFSDLQPGKIATLGAAPDDERIWCELRSRTTGGGIDFWVINGAWSGTLYEGDEGCLYIIEARGERHEPVYITGVDDPPKREVFEPDENEVPF